MKPPIKILVVLFSLVIPLMNYAFTHATHMYISEQTYDIWENYDPSFYYDLQNDAMVEKFYLLGTTLPDLFSMDENELLTIADNMNSGIEITSFDTPLLLKILYYGYTSMLPILDEAENIDIEDIISELSIDSYTSVFNFQNTFDIDGNSILTLSNFNSHIDSLILLIDEDDAEVELVEEQNNDYLLDMEVEEFIEALVMYSFHYERYLYVINNINGSACFGLETLAVNVTFENKLLIKPQTLTDMNNMTFPSSSYFFNSAKEESPYKNMVTIAKSGSYSSLEKALIYGCYTHILQDNYADYVAQPSLFGYGNNFVDTKYDGNYILYDAESLYEMFFGATSIPTQTDWNRVINKVFDDKFNILKNGSILLETYKTFLEADVIIDAAGNGKYDAIEGLCSALNQQLNINTFTYEGMKPFIHIWNILLYEIYGSQTTYNTDIGGIYSNTDWGIFSTLRHYIRKLQGSLFIAGFPAVEILNFVFLNDIDSDEELFTQLIETILESGIISIFGYDFELPGNILDYLNVVAENTNYFWEFSNEWETYFTDNNILTSINYILNGEDKRDFSNLVLWNQHCTEDKPLYDYQTYEDEMTKIINHKSVIKNIIDGNAELEHSKIVIGQKAGIAGGMQNYENPLPTGVEVYDQPGIIDLHFAFPDGNVAFGSSHIPITDKDNDLKLVYDIVTYGPTKILVKDSLDALVESISFSNAQRYSGVLPIDLDGILNSTDELYFEIKTANINDTSSYYTMLKSDFTSAYNNIQDSLNIYAIDSIVYSELFNNGDPFVCKNPIVSIGDQDENSSGPKYNWPYAIKIMDAGLIPPYESINFDIKDDGVVIADETDFIKIKTLNTGFASVYDNYDIYTSTMYLYTLKALKYIANNDGIFGFKSWECSDAAKVDFADKTNCDSCDVAFYDEDITIYAEYDLVSNIQDCTITINEEENLTIPAGANISCASGFEILLEGTLIIDGSSSSITLQGAGKETTFDTSTVRPPVPASSLIHVMSNSAQLSINNATLSDYPCAIRVRDNVGGPNISISNTTIDDCNIGIKFNKLYNKDIELTNINFSNSHNGIIFGTQMSNASQESEIEISFCTFSNIDDFGIFMFQELSTNSSSNVKIYAHNNTFYDVGTVFYNGELTGITPGRYQIWSNNNIFSDSKCLDGVNFDPTDIIESYNLLYNVTGYTNFDDSNNITQSPAFTDATNGDFSLQLTSPAIDSGDEYFAVLGNDYELDEDGTVPDRGSIPYEFPGLAGTRSGTLIIDKDTTIASGYTSTLVSGSILRFNAGCELTVNGDLVANNVTFRPNATTTSLTYWDGIYGSSTADIDLRNSTIKNANRGVETYSAKAYIDNCTIDSCDYGVYLSGLTSGSAVRNCDFNYNDDGAKILYNTTYLNLYNNTFEDNDGWAVYLYQSNTHMYNNTINNNEDGVYSWRSNGTYSENTITNSNDDGIAFLQYASVDMNLEWEAETNKPTNNVITGHGDDGVIVTASAAPNLGTAQTIIPEEIMEAGFNTIDNNTGLDVYRTSTGASVNAQGNDWGASMSVSTNVSTDPEKDELTHFEFYKRTAKSNEPVYINPINDGYKLEGDSLFVEAIDYYENYIKENPDGAEAIQAIVRLAGCYFKLETPLEDMIDELDDLHKSYGNTKAGNTAKHYLAGLYVCQGKHNEALQCNSAMINTFVENNDSEMAANAYMDGVIFCETIPDDGNSLNKSTLQNNMATYITELFENYPNSEAAKTIAKMFDLVIPAENIPTEYKLYSCYPNPYNPVTTIAFDLPQLGRTKMDIYNIRGQLIQTIVEGEFKAGHYEIIFNANDLSSGIYIYKLTAGDYISVEKMTLLK